MRFIFTIKIFFLFILSITFIVLFRSYHKKYVQNKCEHANVVDQSPNTTSSILGEINGLKYILQWTTPTDVPFVYMGEGRKVFIENRCPLTNCVVTSNRTLLKNLTAFDVIVFAGPEVLRRDRTFLPQERSPHQKYVFASIESAHNYPACSNHFENYFNWTWTYRLDSEIRWGYITIMDLNDNAIGPNKEMDWLPHHAMHPVSVEFKAKLKSKSRAAVWFVSNCITLSGREDFMFKLRPELRKYNLSLDVYGECAIKKCVKDCYEKIDEHYYFYLSFENAFSEDYVTEKLLIALKHNAVPVVYGGANYSRFLPNNSYLNARELGVEKLAEKMYKLIQKPDEYADYFRWRNHYSYHKTSENAYTDEYCKMCTLLNDNNMVKATSIKKNFRDWWSLPAYC